MQPLRYETPESRRLSTVGKMARLAWEAREKSIPEAVADLANRVTMSDIEAYHGTLPKLFEEMNEAFSPEPEPDESINHGY